MFTYHLSSEFILSMLGPSLALQRAPANASYPPVLPTILLSPLLPQASASLSKIPVVEDIDTRKTSSMVSIDFLHVFCIAVPTHIQNNCLGCKHSLHYITKLWCVLRNSVHSFGFAPTECLISSILVSA